MKYDRFEDLPVWKDASRLFQRVDAIADDKAFERRWSMADQLHRAALSVSNNIAEGFERGTTAELIAFVYYARGSAGEVRSVLWQMLASPRFEHHKSEISDLKPLSESISRQLRAWADSLQNTDIMGQKFLTDASREAYEGRRRADEFRARLGQIVLQGRPKGEEAIPVNVDAADKADPARGTDEQCGV